MTGHVGAQTRRVASSRLEGGTPRRLAWRAGNVRIAHLRLTVSDVTDPWRHWPGQPGSQPGPVSDPECPKHPDTEMFQGGSPPKCPPVAHKRAQARRAGFDWTLGGRERTGAGCGGRSYAPADIKALFVCGYHTGARKNELRRIRWEQVDFDGSLIRLPASQTKTKKPRTLPIYGDMRRWLELQRARCPADCVWVFYGTRNHPVGNHLSGWAEACERAGLTGLLFHDLRRSAVRNMKRAGIQDKVAMDISGHRTRSVFDRYNIVDEADLRGAGERLEEYAKQRKRERAARLRRVK
jgi:hypothetical protein